MTWNVWGRFGDRWLRRQRAIADTVRAQRPEFVALQETWRSDGQTQAEMLGIEGITYSSRNPCLGRGEWLEDHRIDYILVNGGLRPTGSRLAGFDEDHGRPPSDHRGDHRGTGHLIYPEDGETGLPACQLAIATSVHLDARTVGSGGADSVSRSTRDPVLVPTALEVFRLT